MPNIDNVTVIYPTEYSAIEVSPGVFQDVTRVESETRTHLKVSLESLLSITAYQVIEEELRRVGKYTPEQAKKLRQFTHVRQFSYNEPTVLSEESNSLFKDGFAHPMIYRPVDYADQIPKGE